jgi:hypothetical protein
VAGTSGVVSDLARDEPSFASLEWLQLGAVANHQSRPRQAGTEITGRIR